MGSMQQELPIPLGAEDRTFDNLSTKSQFSHGLADAQAGSLVHCRVAHDSSFSHLAAPGLELRLDENHHLPVVLEQRRQRRENQRNRDEADVANGQIHFLADFLEAQVTGVDAFAEDDARVGAQLPVDLARADVDGMDASGAVLKETIGEAASGCADVETDLAGDVDGEVFQRSFEFQAAAANVRRPAGDFEAAIQRDGLAGLGAFLTLNEDGAGQDEGAGLFARFGQPRSTRS